ncbi:hypothetical protein ADUPG1_010529, partial [Aduncisulcus paluster]
MAKKDNKKTKKTIVKEVVAPKEVINEEEGSDVGEKRIDDMTGKSQGLKEKIEVEASSETMSGDSTFNGSELAIPSGGGSLGS